MPAKMEMNNTPKEDQQRLFPSEMLCKIYGYLQRRSMEKKTWQMVCRAWYYSVNDKPTIQISVPLDDGSYKRLYEDLVKYPTFRLKVSSISDVVEYLASPTLEASQYFPATSYTPKEGEDYNSTYFYSVLGFCPFLNKRCLSPKSIKWLHQCLEKRRHQYRSQEEANHILNVKELISQKRFGGTSGRITQHKR